MTMPKLQGLGHLAAIADHVAAAVDAHPEVAAEIEALVVAIIRARIAAKAAGGTQPAK
jgi:hypothetical protein